MCLFCSVFTVCLPTAIKRFSIWNMWKSTNRKQRMSNFASLTLCLTVVFFAMFISSCLILAAMDKNPNSSQAEHTYSLHQQKATLTNTPDEAVPLSHLPEAAKSVFEADPTLLSTVAVSVSWFLEFLSRLRRKGAKKTLKQLSFNGTICDPSAAVPPSPMMNPISQNISNNEGNDVNP